MEKLSQQKIKDIKKLQLKKHRNAEQMIYLEGETLIKDLLQEFPQLIEAIILTEDKTPTFEGTNKPCFIAPLIDLEKLTQLKTPKKVNALVRYPKTKPWKAGQKALLLDQIQDPGNLGTIIRTADWFGIKQIVCSEDSVHHLNSKVIQASMGSAFRIPVFYENLIEFLPKLGIPIHGALLNGENLKDVQASEIKILVMGNEGKGISESLQAHINQAVTIPGFGQAESLNVSMATGIFLYHWSQSERK